MTINALIIAPEITKGMKSIGSKALLEIKNKQSVIDYQIQQLKSISKYINITIATGFDNEKISRHISQYTSVNIIFNSEYKNTNEAASLQLYLKEYDIDNLLIINNGILLKNNPITQKCLENTSSKIFLLNNSKSHFNIGCNKNHSLEYLFYDLDEPWSECVFLNYKAISSLKTIISKHNIDQMFIFEIINEILSMKNTFEKKYIDKKNIMKISAHKDIPRAKVFI